MKPRAMLVDLHRFFHRVLSALVLVTTCLGCSKRTPSVPLDEMSPIECLHHAPVSALLGVSQMPLREHLTSHDECVPDDLRRLAQCALEPARDSRIRAFALELVVVGIVGQNDVIADQEEWGRMCAFREIRDMFVPPCNNLPSETRPLLHRLWVTYAGKEEASAILADLSNDEPVIAASARRCIPHLGALIYSDHAFRMLQSDSSSDRALALTWIANLFPSPSYVEILASAYESESRADKREDILKALQFVRYSDADRLIRRIAEQELDPHLRELSRGAHLNWMESFGFLIGNPHYGIQYVRRSGSPRRDLIEELLSRVLRTFPTDNDTSRSVLERWEQSFSEVPNEEFLVRIIDATTVDYRFLSLGESMPILTFCPYPEETEFRLAYLGMLEDSNHWFAQVCAARALATMGDFQAVPYLIRALAQDEDFQRDWIIRSPEATIYAMQTLREISGENFLIDADAWKAWWNGHEKSTVDRFGLWHLHSGSP